MALRTNIGKDEIRLRQQCFAGAFASLLTEVFSSKYDPKDITKMMTEERNKMEAEMMSAVNFSMDDLMKPN